MKKLAALVLSAALLAGSAAAVTPEEAFPPVNTYPGFIDVEEGAWYADAARVCCEVGLMQGTGHAFEPGHHRGGYPRGHPQARRDPALVFLLCGVP